MCTVISEDIISETISHFWFSFRQTASCDPHRKAVTQTCLDLVLINQAPDRFKSMCQGFQQDLVSSTSCYNKYPLIAPFIYIFCLYCMLYQAIRGSACQQIRPIHLPPCDGLALVVCWTCLSFFFPFDRKRGRAQLWHGAQGFSPVMLLRLEVTPLPLTLPARSSLNHAHPTSYTNTPHPPNALFYESDGDFCMVYHFHAV